MILNSLRPISLSLCDNRPMRAVMIISPMVSSSSPLSYTLRRYAFICVALILPLLPVSTLANAASRPASDLSMSSPKTDWKPAVKPSNSNVFSSPVTKRPPVALTPSPTALAPSRLILPTKTAPSTVAEPTALAPSRLILPTKTAPSTVARPAAFIFSTDCSTIPVFVASGGGGSTASDFGCLMEARQTA